MVEKIKKNLIAFAIVIIGVCVVGGIIYIRREKAKETAPAALVPPETPTEEEPLANLAKCLTEKGVKFYGTYWCGWCKKQKELFGEAAKYLPYVECDPKRATKEELAMCKEANVSSIPDWRFPDGRRELGLQPLEKLVEFSGC